MILFLPYLRYYYSESDKRGICDKECRKNIICDMRSGVSHNRQEFCKDIIF